MNIIPAVSAPEFKDIKNWSDNAKHSIKELKGKVVLLDFWTYTCIFCLRTIPTIKQIKGKYTNNDLVVIGIHSAEYEFAKNTANIKRALMELGVDEYLTGYDTNNKTWEVYGNSYWPKHILVDRDGFVRYEHPGYGTFDDFEEALTDLLDLPYSNPKLLLGKDDWKSPDSKDNLFKENDQDQNEVTKIYGMHFSGMAPEICVGYSRLRRFGNNQKVKINEYNVFTEPPTLLDNTVYLRGKWRWDKEGVKASSDHKEKHPAIIFKYNMASNVNVLVGSTDEKPALANIKLDGEFLTDQQLGYHVKKDSNSSFFEITWPHIMNIVKTLTPEIHVLEILPKTDNFCFYTFVFG
ncbi:redoxin family protein [Candidatus Nitrosocosmicus arcticus]|uniref:Putative cytochrome c biogenesis protein transmembrane region n=1 Tax=Candidatus Nitrosocosmicus arcticus TaxID=2035267 RepID=A0A557SVS5_9ARCH|nr:redoxin family protein [Candidatus Nitrosocosmicus arcticus]TVP40705.1 putative cytochrome c biogenesis protein transmembrane region [Candidatus Nitrosocosmicus arcticus]